MEKIPVDRPDAPIHLRRVLSEGGVAVVPTDTLYGLSTSMSSHRGHERILAIKRSMRDRPFLYLACDAHMVERYISGWGCASRRILEAVWPAPLTAVLPSGGRCPARVGKTIAFRVPFHPLLRAAIGELGEPIVSTSVNEAGEPPLNDVDSIEQRFGALVDLIVEAGTLPGGLPSTIVDFTGEEPIVLRAGSYTWGGAENPGK